MDRKLKANQAYTYKHEYGPKYFKGRDDLRCGGQGEKKREREMRAEWREARNRKRKKQ